MYINPNLNCGKIIEASYYSSKMGPMRCSDCAVEIDDAENLAEIAMLTSKFYVVYPKCGDKACGAHVTHRPRKNNIIAERKTHNSLKRKKVNILARAKKHRKMTLSWPKDARSLRMQHKIPKLTVSNLQGEWMTSMTEYWGWLREGQCF